MLYPNCCGLDVHKDSVVASRKRGRVRVTKTFGTTTRALEDLADWLGEGGCTHVAMESTGPYWKPVYNILEDRFALVVVNTRDLRMVPGRKSDVKDAEWIADLLQVGLLRPSFVPGREERELRELNRYRESLVGERTAEVNRIQKVLEGANVKLGSVASDVSGVSGRAMLEAMVAGVDDSKVLAKLAVGKLKSKAEELEEALLGAVGAHQRFLLQQQLRHLTELDAHIEAVSEEIRTRLAPKAEAQANLDSIPGIGERVAQTILCETGGDLGKFPTERHFASWVGLCPGINESAGVKKSGKTTKGNRWLRTAMTQAARAASRRTDGNAVTRKYKRLKPRLGGKKATTAVAHALLTIVYHVLTRHEPYKENLQELREAEERTRQGHVRSLERLGYKVDLIKVPG